MSGALPQLRWLRPDRAHPEVERYVQDHPHACYAHSTQWTRTIWRCYRIPTFTLASFSAGRVTGVAPLSVLCNPLIGPYAVIGPFASYGDLLADDGALASALLRRAARDLARFGVRHVQVRSASGRLDATPSVQRSIEGRLICPRVDVRDGASAVWDHRLEVRARNAVRRARKLGVRIEAVDDPRALMRVIDAGNRRLGSPFHGLRYFRSLQHHFGSRLQLWSANVGGAAAAVAVSLIDRDGLYYLYGQNDAALRSTAANALLVWHLIETACANGLGYVDLGRSEVGSPHQRFKRQWGGVDRPIWDLIVAARSSTLPDLSPTNAAFSLAQRAWSRLPLDLTRRLGPLLIRGFG